MKKGKRPTALGCYIFAGGFTLGVRKHFDVLAHFEEGPYGTETAQHNIPELRGHVHTDPGSWPVEDYSPDFVYGNPPCAPWSVCSAGRAVPWRLDPRTGCAQRLYDLLGRMQPKVWAWESVRPAFTKGREMVDAFVANAPKGYAATALLVEGTRHGVPQRRPRFFLVLSKYDMPWDPTREKREPTVGGVFAKKFPTFTGTETPEMYLKLLRKAQPGERLSKVFNRTYPKRVEALAEGDRMAGRPSFQNIRLLADRPSCTLTGGAKQFHPTEDRLITVEESAALCGYPRDFKFLGAVGKQYAQVAQAVMPPVGEYIARIAAAAIAAKKPARGGFEQVEIFADRVDRQNLIILPPGKAAAVAPRFAPPPPLPKIAKALVGKPSAPGQRRLGSGFRIRQMLAKGMAPSAILAVVRKEFPDSKAKESDVYWNKRKLQTQGGVP